MGQGGEEVAGGTFLTFAISFINDTSQISASSNNY